MTIEYIQIEDLTHDELMAYFAFLADSCHYFNNQAI